MIIPTKLLFLCFLFKFVFNNEGIITLSFKKEIPNLNGVQPKKVIDPTVSDNLIMTEIKIGTEPQAIKLRIELSSYLFYISGYNTLSQIKFDQRKSETYRKNEDKSHYFSQSKLNEGILSSDFIYYENNNDKKYNTTFILGTDTEKEKSGGLIGLKFDDKTTQSYTNYNFINEIKKIGVIKDYYFTIKYKDNNSGELIVGDLPHNYDNNYKNKEFKTIYTNLEVDDKNWSMDLDLVYIADEQNSNNKSNVGEKIYARLKIEKSIIEGTSRFHQKLKNYFMDELINNNLCYEIKSDNYISYYCKQEANISKLKNIYFFNKELNFTFELTYNDLFYHNEYDGNNYFLVVFPIDDEEYGYSSYYWTLGEPLFKKYQFVFNKNSKIIGLYVNTTITLDDNKDETKPETWWSRNKWYIILIIILVIVLSVLGLMIYLYIKNKPKRKIKANELDDNYEYNLDPSKNKLIN